MMWVDGGSGVGGLFALQVPIERGLTLGLASWLPLVP